MIAVYTVVRNDEEQYSIWPADETAPAGWHPVGQQGSEQRCLEYIDQVWTDLRPLRLRRPAETDTDSARRWADYNTTDREYNPDRGLTVCVAEIAATAPERIALDTGTAKLSYQGLDRHANRLCRHLTVKGVEPGDRVALLFERSPEFVIGLLGVLKAGATAVPLDPEHPDAAVAAVLTDAGVWAVLTRAGLAHRVPPDLTAVCLDRDGDVTVAHADDPVARIPHPDEIAMVFYTSGTSGEPKGVRVRHRAFANIIAWTQTAYLATAADHASWMSSPAFAIAAQEWMPFLAIGATLHLADETTARDPQLARDWLLERGVTFCVLVAPLAERMWTLDWPDSVALRFMFATGAPVRRWPAPELPFEVVVFYATTETLVTTSCFDAYTGLRATPNVTAAADRRSPPLPVGRPVGNMQVYLLDPDGDPVPTDVVGELYVAGAGLAAGYHGKPELTAERFIRGVLAEQPDTVLYRTGDLARYLPDGTIEVIGRADDAVKIRGYRVEPAAVEATLEALESVREAAVLVQSEGTGEPRLVGYVVAETGLSDLTAAWLSEQLAQHLPPYMVPSAFIILDALPRLPSGKFNRHALPAAGATTRSEPGSAYVAPTGIVESGVAELWSRLLGGDPIGVHDDFFALGGHSLAAVDLVTQLTAEYGAQLSLADLYRARTVANLAALIEAQVPDLTAGAPEPVDPAEAAGFAPVAPEPTNRHDPFPLTDTQYAYWIGRGDAVELGNVGCHGYFEWENPELDVSKLRRAWQRLVERHDALRLVIRPDGTQQVLADPPTYEIAVLDLRDRDPDAAEEAILALRAELAHQVLPADTWPLFDVRVTLLPSGVARLHLSFDLLITDAWSYVQLLIPDLVRLYEDADLEQPALMLTFRDYVVGVAAQLESSPAYQTARQYWQDQLCTLPPAPDLPRAAGAPTTAGTRPLAAPRFQRRADRLAAEDWQALQRRAQTLGITPTCLLITGFAEVLRSWSHNDTFTLNCPLFNRAPVHPQVNELVGDFTTTSLLAIAKADGTVAERAGAIQQRMWEDLQHRHFSGVRVMRELSRLSGTGVRAAFPVVVTSMLGQPPARLATALGEEIYAISQTPQVSLDFQIWPSDDGIRFNWDSVDEVFPAGMVQDMFVGYRDLLHRLIHDDQVWQEERLMMVPRHQLAQRARINDTRVPVPDALLHSALGKYAGSQPDRPAVVTTDRTLNYRELHQRANQIGRQLRALGAGANELIAVVMDKGWEQFAAVYGVLTAGAAYLPIDAAVPADRLRLLLQQGEVRFVLTRRAEETTVDWPSAVQVLCVDRDFDQVDAAAVAPAQQPTDLAYVIFTSGSTGTPKGVMVDHRGALNTILDVNTRFAIGAEDCCIAVSGLHFDLSVYDVFGTINAGGAVAVPDPTATPDPAGWARLMTRAGVTFWNSVPALLEMLVTHLENRGATQPASRLRLAVLAGDWIPTDLPARLRALNPATRFIASGGPAETCVWSVIYPVGTVPESWTSIPYGRPMSNQRYHVLDRQRRPRPTWVPGEIYIASEVGLAKGYWRDPQRTEQQFVTLPESGHRAYASGDIGRYLPDGNLEILGREDFQVKIQGIRIELGEIEAAIHEYPAVAAVAVVAASASRDLPVLHAFVTWQTNAAGASIAELRRFLVSKLPGYLIPPQITCLEQLPLTRNGKVDRLALSTRPGHEETADAGHTAPGTALERVVCQLWTALLGVDQIGLDDDFFALGGNSLSATKIVGELRELLGVELSLHELFVSPTPAAVCVAATRDPKTRDAVLAMAGALDELTLEQSHHGQGG